MKFTVHQIRKDRKAEKEAIDARFFGKVASLFFLTAYEEVCVIEAETLDEVFEIGNIGPEEKIERLNRMHSISVGDVISNEYHECFTVESFGFGKVGQA